MASRRGKNTAVGKEVALDEKPFRPLQLILAIIIHFLLSEDSFTILQHSSAKLELVMIVFFQQPYRYGPISRWRISYKERPSLAVLLVCRGYKGVPG